MPHPTPLAAARPEPAERPPSAAPKLASNGLADAVTHLAAIVARLRAPGGCAWDAEQTHASLVPYLLEEAAEAAAAARADAPDALRDELGDVLLQVVLHAQIAGEAGHFDFAAVARGLADKLVRRHPHVFGGEQAADGAAAKALWAREKAAERAQDKAPAGALDGVPTALPALQRAQKVARRAAKVGFDWPDITGPFAKLDEELEEVRQAMAKLTAARATGDASARARAQAALADEVGDALFSLAIVARHLEVDAEETLHATLGRFGARFAYVEQALGRRGLRPAPAHVDLMGELWQEAKRNLA